MSGVALGTVNYVIDASIILITTAPGSITALENRITPASSL
jgi:hypothetical protein